MSFNVPDMDDILWFSQRGVIYEDVVTRTCDALAEDHPQVLDILNLFEWILSRKPDNKFAIQLQSPHDKMWLISTKEIGGIFDYEVTLMYFFDAKNVTFYNIRIEKVSF
jgi:hypothetical protein